MMKNLLTLSLLILFILPSCLKTDQEEPEIIIDGTTYESVTVWKEIAQKEVENGVDSISDQDWIAISEGHSLTLFLNSLNDSWKEGLYRYNSTHLGLAIGSAGEVSLRDSVLQFMKSEDGNRDTLASVTFLMKGDSVLILQNRNVDPNKVLKFKHEVTHENVIH